MNNRPRTDLIKDLKGSKDVMHIMPLIIIITALQSFALLVVRTIGLMPT